MTERMLLTGIKVLDVGSYLAGPAAATVMADFGADVIKIEPREGDPYRQLGAPAGMAAPVHNAFWVQDARSKRSVSLDLKDSRGRATLLRMVAQSDVFLTNYRPQLLERLHLRWEDLRGASPRLIYASVTGYGEVGPKAASPGFDTTAWWAGSGLMDYVRWPGTTPAVSAPGMGDHATAMSVFGGIMAALFDRERTGKGTKVTSSLLANGLWSNSMLASVAMCGQPIVSRNVPAEQIPSALAVPYAARDGYWLMLTLLNEEKEWPNLLLALDATALDADERFCDRAARRTHSNALRDVLTAAFARFTREQLTMRLGRNQVTYGWTATLADIPHDEQLHAAGILTPIAEGERQGLTHLVSSPLWIESSAKAAPRYSPTIGQHSAEVLREFGLTEDEVGELMRSGVAYCEAANERALLPGTVLPGTAPLGTAPSGTLPSGQVAAE